MVRSHRWLALALTFLLPLLAVAALCWPLPLQLDRAFSPSIFGPSHVWTGEHLWQVLTQGEPLHSSLRAGYPWPRQGRFIGWLPLLAMLPLRLALGPLSAFHIAELLALPLSALAAWPLLRRWTGAGPWALAAGCLAFALCPFALGTFATGELPKLQIGLIPLFLYALDRACDARPWRWALAAAALASITAFTSPYFGLTIPLLSLGLLGADALRRRRLRRPLLLGLLVAAALLPAWAYYRTEPLPTELQLFMPAMSGGLAAELPSPHPVASLKDLLVGPRILRGDPWLTRHVPYLGSLLLGALALLSLLGKGRRQGRRTGLILLGAGALLALGPQLYLVDQAAGLPLPAGILALLRYPLVEGGMYYRLAILASLGLALWLVAETARRPWLAWALLALQLADAVRASGPWPLQVVPVPAVERMAEMRGRDGAVLNLPLERGLTRNQRSLLQAALHGRPTNALPRMFMPAEMRALAKLSHDALADEDPAGSLRALGVRYLVAGKLGQQRQRDYVSRLGEPWVSDKELRIWDLGPTELVPRSAEELLVAPPHRP